MGPARRSKKYFLVLLDNCFADFTENFCGQGVLYPGKRRLMRSRHCARRSSTNAARSKSPGPVGDDEYLMRGVLVEILQDCGFRVVAVVSGEEAVKFLSGMIISTLCSATS